MAPDLNQLGIPGQPGLLELALLQGHFRLFQRLVDRASVLFQGPVEETIAWR